MVVIMVTCTYLSVNLPTPAVTVRAITIAPTDKHCSLSVLQIASVHLALRAWLWVGEGVAQAPGGVATVCTAQVGTFVSKHSWVHFDWRKSTGTGRVRLLDVASGLLCVCD